MWVFSLAAGSKQWPVAHLQIVIHYYHYFSFCGILNFKITTNTARKKEVSKKHEGCITTVVTPYCKQYC